MSTDTALALGFLSLVGQGVSDKVRVFLLTAFVVDDIVALIVIAVVCSGDIAWLPLVVAVGVFAVLLALLRVGVDRPTVYAVLGLVIWGALLISGVDPVVTGLAIGLAGSAYSPSRDTLERASSLSAAFVSSRPPRSPATRSSGSAPRSPPAPASNASTCRGRATSSCRCSVQPTPGSPSTDRSSGGPDVTGHPRGGRGLCARQTGHRPRCLLRRDPPEPGPDPPAGRWAALAGSGTIAGTAFTVSLLIAALAFTGPELAEVKLGILLAAVLSVALTAAVFRATDLPPPERRARALLGRAELAAASRCRSTTSGTTCGVASTPR